MNVAHEKYIVCENVTYCHLATNENKVLYNIDWIKFKNKYIQISWQHIAM